MGEANVDTRLLSDEHLAVIRRRVGHRSASYLDMIDAENDIALQLDHIDAQAEQLAVKARWMDGQANNIRVYQEMDEQQRAVNDLLRERNAALEAAQRWTTELPTVEGWYWHRAGPTYEASILQVHQFGREAQVTYHGGLMLVVYDGHRNGRFDLVEQLGGEWSGPLPEPNAGLPTVSIGDAQPEVTDG